MTDNEQPTASEVLLLTFRRERETKNTVRYEEVVTDTPSARFPHVWGAISLGGSTGLLQRT
jgi:uncharacterized protein (DUF952 family)